MAIGEDLVVYKAATHPTTLDLSNLKESECRKSQDVNNTVEDNIAMNVIDSCSRGCRSAWTWLIDIRPQNPPLDPDCRLWYERAKCSRLEPLLPFVQMAIILLDAIMDFEVALTHYQGGYYEWSLYTFLIVLVAQIILQAISAMLFWEDKQNEDKSCVLRHNGLEVNCWTFVCHIFIFGRFLRFYQMWRVVRKIRSQGAEPHNDKEAQRHYNYTSIRRFTLFISQSVDCNTLGLMEAFLEQAPQVGLQLYILLRQSHIDLTSFSDLLVMLNIMKSLLLFALSHLSFTRSIRKSNKESAQLGWVSWGSVTLYLWRLFMLVSRILALALFASIFKEYTFVLVGLHYVLFFGILQKQQCEYFENNSVKQNLFKLAVAYVHIFSFFPLVPNNTRNWGLIYYVITFLENTAMVVLWAVYTDFGLTFMTVVVVAEGTSFALGVVALVLYHCCFRPSLGQRELSTERRNGWDICSVDAVQIPGCHVLQHESSI